MEVVRGLSPPPAGRSGGRENPPPPNPNPHLIEVQSPSIPKCNSGVMKQDEDLDSHDSVEVAVPVRSMNEKDKTVQKLSDQPPSVADGPFIFHPVFGSQDKTVQKLSDQVPFDFSPQSSQKAMNEKDKRVQKLSDQAFNFHSFFSPESSLKEMFNSMGVPLVKETSVVSDGPVLDVTVVGCRGLRCRPISSDLEPYVRLQYGNLEFRTSTCTDGGAKTDGGSNPIFEDKLQIPLIEGIRKINLSVWDSITYFCIGIASVPLHKVLTQGYHDCYVLIQNQDRMAVGEVYLIMRYAGASKEKPSGSETAPPYNPPPASADPPVALGLYRGKFSFYDQGYTNREVQI